MTWIEELGKIYRSHEDSFFIDVDVKELDKVFDKLIEKGIDRISSITVNDAGDVLEIIYHFVYGKVIINIRAKIPAKKPEIKSVVGKFPGAELIEREIWEMMGVEPVGHPDLRNLLLDEKLSPKTPGRKK